MRVLLLYRPRLPGLRAQAIQVLHAAHALAGRGHRVTLLADRAPGFRGGPAEVLARMGLDARPGLDLRLAPSAHPTAAGLWFRAAVRAWLLAHGEPPVVLARSKALAAALLPLRRLRPFPLVLEVHELDSAQARERGALREARRFERLERRVLAGASGLLANCEGTLEAWEERWGPLLPPLRRAVHNGTRPDRVRPPLPHRGLRAGYLGSLRAYKRVDLLVEAARELPPGHELWLVGGAPGEPDYEALRRRLPPRLRLAPAVPVPEVSRLLARLDAGVLALGTDLYGRRLASPLKLWDFLAAGLPVAAPDLPSVRAICGEDFEPWTPGDPSSLARAVLRALRSPRRPPRLRSWDQRAAEVEELLEAAR